MVDNKLSSQLQEIGSDTIDTFMPADEVRRKHGDLEYQNLGSYLQFQKKLSDMTEITLGARYDYNTRYGSTVNPRAGVVLTLNEKTKSVK